MATTYDVGDVARVQTTVTQGGAVVDPTGIAVTVRTPDGLRVTYTYGVGTDIVKSGTGVYYLDFPVAQTGRHWVRWVSTGTGAGAEEEYFEVRVTQTLQ